MIGKVLRNGSFYKTAHYVLNKTEAERIGGNMAGLSLHELVSEFMMSRNLNTTVERPVYHFILSLPHHENLADEQFAQIADEYLEGMGLDLSEHQYFVARHSDRTHSHVHIVASRINVLTSRVADGSFERYRSQEVLRKLEQKYELSVVPCSWEVGKRSLSKSQLLKSESTGKLSVQTRLQQSIERAAANAPRITQFLDRLMSEGVQVKITWSEGSIRGISYRLDSVAMSGSQLGSRYSFPGLQQHLGVRYQSDRDDLYLYPAALTDLEKERIRQNFYAQQIAETVARTATLIEKLAQSNVLDGQKYRIALRRSTRTGEVRQVVLYSKKGKKPKKVLTITNPNTPNQQLFASGLLATDCRYFDSVKSRLKKLEKQSDLQKGQIVDLTRL